VAGLISDNTLDQIRAANDIVDVIGGYLPLKRAGANFVALCPFHKEKSPSFNVNPHRQTFHCFGCNKGGNVFRFLMEYENIGFVDAVRRLADRAKIPLEMDQNPAAQQSRHIKDQLLQIHEQITQRWQNCLANEAAGQLARDYLAKRGVSAEAIKLFRLGAAPEAWDDTVNWAKSKDYDLAVMEQAGLILKKEETGRHYDRFRGRLMFPICDEQGRVIGFSGRILTGDEKTAKYVNSPETPIFTKSKVFFGLDKSKRALLDAQVAIVCEGQLDLIACFMSGIQNVVAPQGTAFTDQHARILKRFVEKIVLCFDSDNAGQKAAVRSLDTLLTAGPELLFQRRDKSSGAIGRLTGKMIGDLLPAGLAIGVATIPSPHDPDSFIKENGADAFRKLIAAAPDFFDYLLDRLCSTNDINTDLGRRSIMRAMSEAVMKTGNEVVIDKYAQKTALRLGVMPDAVRKEFRKANVTAVANAAEDEYFDSAAAEAEGEAMERPTPLELGLLKLVLRHEAGIEWLGAHLDSQWIHHSQVRDIVSRRLQLQREATWRNLAAFLDEFESGAVRSLMTELISDDHDIPNPDQQLADVTLRLRNQFVDRQMALLTQTLGQPEATPGEHLELLRELQQWRQYKKQPLAPLA
jgi:DNA primase